MDDAILHAALRWFPRTGHPKPACPPLPGRVREAPASRLPPPSLAQTFPPGLPTPSTSQRYSPATAASQAAVPSCGSGSDGVRPGLATEEEPVLYRRATQARIRERFGESALALIQWIIHKTRPQPGS